MGSIEEIYQLSPGHCFCFKWTNGIGNQVYVFLEVLNSRSDFRSQVTSVLQLRCPETFSRKHRHRTITRQSINEELCFSVLPAASQFLLFSNQNLVAWIFEDFNCMYCIDKKCSCHSPRPDWVVVVSVSDSRGVKNVPQN